MTLPPLPPRDVAREAAHRELAKPGYAEAKPPWTYRAVQWLIDKLNELLDKTTASVPGGRLGVLLLVLLVGGVIALVVTRLRPSVRTARADELFDGGRALTAEEHRELAEAAARRGDYADAVRERLRAVVRQLEERGTLDARPGRTTEELAHEVGLAVPSLSEPLHRATHVFEEVWYGGRPADRSSYEVLVEVDR